MLIFKFPLMLALQAQQREDRRLLIFMLVLIDVFFHLEVPISPWHRLSLGRLSMHMED
jgi:hypothetical protein